ncbi:MAG: hypothetical protein V1839_04020 [archaeon]
MELELWGYKFPRLLTAKQFEIVMEQAAETLELKLDVYEHKDGSTSGELTNEFTHLGFTTVKEKGKIAGVDLNPYDVRWTTPYTKAIIAAYEVIYGKSAS